MSYHLCLAGLLLTCLLLWAGVDGFGYAAQDSNYAYSNMNQGSGHLNNYEFFKISLDPYGVPIGVRPVHPNFGGGYGGYPGGYGGYGFKAGAADEKKKKVGYKLFAIGSEESSSDESYGSYEG